MTSEFATRSTVGNTRRTLVVLLLDISGSMNAASQALPGKTRAGELFAATQVFLSHHLKNTGLYETGEIAVGVFNDRVQWLNLGAASRHQGDFYRMNEKPEITSFPAATGTTVFGAAIAAAYEKIDERRAELRRLGASFQNKPQVYLVTDGSPTDLDAVPHLTKLIGARSITPKGDSLFYSFGVKGAEFDVLRRLTPVSTYDLGTTALEEVLRLVSESIRTSLPVASRHGHTDPDSSNDFDSAYLKVRLGLPNDLYRGFDSDYAG